MGRPLWEQFFVSVEDLQPLFLPRAGCVLREPAGVRGGVYQFVPSTAPRGTRERGRPSGGHQERV